MGKLKCVFLDADGVLNTAIMVNDKPAAPTSVDKLDIPDEVYPSLERLKEAGYMMVTITNKPDIERGLMTQEDVDAIFAEMRKQLPQITEIFACFHEGAPCYKPKPGMILEAAKKYDIDLEQSFMIGDRCGDVACGKAAGVKTIWINRHYPLEPKPDPAADFTTESLSQAIDHILGE
jgi:D-glycero-D-manno-heptose 1,7-bisphosphate phosphatase